MKEFIFCLICLVLLISFISAAPDSLYRKKLSRTVSDEPKSCIYIPQGPSIKAFVDTSPIEIKILHHGTVLKFGCDDIGQYRLIGPSEVTCRYGSWIPKFPKCIYPQGDDDVHIIIHSIAKTHILPNDVLLVEEHTKIYIACYTVKRDSWPLLSSSATVQVQSTDIKTRDDILYTMIVIDDVSQQHEGAYFCKSQSEDQHGVYIKVKGQPKNKDVFCSNLESNSISISNNNTAIGTKVSFSCASEHFLLIGPKEITCLETGQWSHKPPICMRQPKNKDVFCSNLESNSISISNNNTAIALTDEKAKCPAIDTVPYLKVFYLLSHTSSSQNAEAQFSCNHTARQLVGPKTIKCLETGQWSEKPPVCEIPCEVPGLRYGIMGRRVGTQNFDKVAASTKINNGSTLILRCQQGYEIPSEIQYREDVEIVCHLGTWKPKPACRPGSCIVPNVSNGVIKSRKVERHWYWGTGISYQKVKIGSISYHKSELYIFCDKTYKLGGLIPTGDDGEKIVCDKKKFVPEPYCLPGRCSDPEDIENGVKEGKDFIQGSEVHYRCNEGYKLIGESVLYCDENGKWSKETPKCKRECNCPEDIQNGDRIGEDFTEGSEVHFTCNKGYKLVGDPVLHCYENGKWSNEIPKCKRECSHPGVIKNGVRRGEDFTEGSEIHYRCNKGYKLVGDSVLHCYGNGQWTSEIPKCKRECSHPGVIKNGVRRGEDFTEGSEIHYRCNKGYKLVGDSVLHCYGNGQWTSEIPKCKRECSHPGVTKNGVRRGEDFTEGSEIHYRCNKGYKLIGDSVLHCYGNGQWTSEIPKCKRECSRPEDIENGVRTGEDFTEGSEIHYTCNKGHKLIGDPLLHCNGDGKWSNEIPKCMSGCYPLQKPSNSTLIIGYEKKEYKIGDMITFSCPPKQKLSFNLHLIACLPTGWSDDQIPECIPRNRNNFLPWQSSTSLYKNAK